MTFAFRIQTCLVSIMTSSVLSEAVYGSFSLKGFSWHSIDQLTLRNLTMMLGPRNDAEFISFWY